uniref:Uncharacterized protein n=1 Tax=Ditylenchus dipsaci TaxID=166011 RepID=A0A915EVJ6_9BILA
MENNYNQDQSHVQLTNPAQQLHFAEPTAEEIPNISYETSSSSNSAIPTADHSIRDSSSESDFERFGQEEIAESDSRRLSEFGTRLANEVLNQVVTGQHEPNASDLSTPNNEQEPQTEPSDYDELISFGDNEIHTAKEATPVKEEQEEEKETEHMEHEHYSPSSPTMDERDHETYTKRRPTITIQSLIKTLCLICRAKVFLTTPRTRKDFQSDQISQLASTSNSPKELSEPEEEKPSVVDLGPPPHPHHLTHRSSEKGLQSILKKTGPWIDFTHVDPKVLEIIYWRDPKRSGGALAVLWWPLPVRQMFFAFSGCLRLFDSSCRNHWFPCLQTG